MFDDPAIQRRIRDLQADIALRTGLSCSESEAGGGEKLQTQLQPPETNAESGG